ncbi:MAG: caspase family protein [Actinomycetota bacterium]|nr:caspase family protein [Actinomycetota bacterium]
MSVVAAPATKGRLHAMVIGVSRYSHRSNLTTPGPAMSAALFAQWLRNEFRHPELALGTMRVLLSPTDQEAEPAAQAAGRIDGEPTRDTVDAELNAWGNRCNRSAADAALLYLAGHGTSMVAAGGLLLLQDFGAPGAALGRALHIDAVRDAMETRVAHANFFFVDACQQTMPEQANITNPQAVTGVDLVPGKRRRKFYRAIYGAAPDEKAWTLAPKEAVKHGTVFSKALLQALKTVADFDDNGRFSVTVNRLIAETALNVERGGDELRKQFGRGIQGTSQASGTGGDRTFHVPEHVPVELSIHLDPETAANSATAKLYRYSRPRHAVLHGLVTLTPQPATLVVDVGKYKLQLTAPPPPAEIDQIDEYVVLPETAHWMVPIEYITR